MFSFMWANHCWIGNFEDVRFYTMLNFGHFLGAPSPVTLLTFQNVRKSGTPGTGISRVFVKTSQAFGEQRFHQKNTNYIVCPASSVFLCCFISVLSRLSSGKKKNKFIKTTFIKKSFIKIHFHQKTLLSKTNLIKNQLHQKPTSSKKHFHQKTTFITNPTEGDRTKHAWGAKNKVRISVRASPAEGRRRFHSNTAYARLSGFNRPSCGGQKAGI